MKKENISANVIRRLPRYIRFLDRMMEAGVVRVSSNEIGAQMGLTASQIRQDFNCFGGFGQQGYGYNVPKLREQLADILGMNQSHTAVLVGAGHFAHALLHNFKFGNCGVQLLAAFDIMPTIVGTSIAGVPIRHIDTLEDYIKDHNVDIVILTLPSSKAEEMAKRAASAGVRGVWNLTNEALSPLPGGVLIESLHLSDSLLTLNYYLSSDSESEKEQEN